MEKSCEHINVTSFWRVVLWTGLGTSCFMEILCMYCPLIRLVWAKAPPCAARRPCRRRSELWQEKQQHVRTAHCFMAALICYLSLSGSAASKWAYIWKSVFLQALESTLLFSVAVTNHWWCILWMLNVWLRGQRYQTGCCCRVRSPLISVCIYRLLFFFLLPFFILLDMHKLVVLSSVIAVSAECCLQIP